ncbi:MAG TPA: tungsten formylmethanofuran dehydrogenase [Desulfotomaculum sp.]|nr:tungsten formylmethanofuran dehydrogenase [Desulfotomaculum sp.]
MARVTFREDRCKGCELCKLVCPKKIIIQADYVNNLGFRPATVKEQEKCTGCTLCALMCPDIVIEVEKEVEVVVGKSIDERQ